VFLLVTSGVCSVVLFTAVARMLQGRAKRAQKPTRVPALSGRGSG